MGPVSCRHFSTRAGLLLACSTKRNALDKAHLLLACSSGRRKVAVIAVQVSAMKVNRLLVRPERDGG